MTQLEVKEHTNLEVAALAAWLNVLQSQQFLHDNLNHENYANEAV